jgi:hypothetical protein
VGTLNYEMKPETRLTKAQEAYIQGTSVLLVVLGLLYFLMVRSHHHHRRHHDGD